MSRKLHNSDTPMCVDVRAGKVVKTLGNFAHLHLNAPLIKYHLARVGVSIYNLVEHTVDKLHDKRCDNVKGPLIN